MAEEAGAHFGALVEGVQFSAEGWRLDCEAASGTAFDAVVIAVPAEQAATLLAPLDAELFRLADATHSDPCWTGMYAFEEPLEGVPDALRDCGPIGWAARNSSKPGRAQRECWVVQGSPEWSSYNLEIDREVACAQLKSALEKAAGVILPPTIAESAHRWRYARSGKAEEGSKWDAEKMLGVCGDWLIAPRVEAAWLSGQDLAQQIAAAA